MSKTATKEIEGDVAIGRNATIGGKAIVRGDMTVGHNLKVEGWLDAPNIKGNNKGLFRTPEALRQAYPTALDGWHALVGSTLPAQLYIAYGGRWVAQTNEDGTPTMTGEARLEDAGLREQIDSIQEVLDRQEETLTEHETQIDGIAPRCVGIDELDTMGTDGGLADMLKFAGSAEKHTQWAVMDGSRKVGVMQVFSDFGPHVLYQVLTTSNQVEDGVLQKGSHRDGVLHTWHRCFVIAGSSLDTPSGEWTPWQHFGAMETVECADEADMAAKAASNRYPEGTQFFIAETD